MGKNGHCIRQYKIMVVPFGHSLSGIAFSKKSNQFSSDKEHSRVDNCHLQAVYGKMDCLPARVGLFKAYLRLCMKARFIHL